MSRARVSLISQWSYNRILNQSLSRYNHPLVTAAEFRNHSPGMIPPPETARANGLLSEVIPLHVSYKVQLSREKEVYKYCDGQVQDACICIVCVVIS